MDLGVGAIEVDVWLGESVPRAPKISSGILPGGGWTEWDLLVGHRQADTSPRRTLTSVYLEPLLDRCTRWQLDQLGQFQNRSPVFGGSHELLLVIDLDRRPSSLTARAHPSPETPRREAVLSLGTSPSAPTEPRVPYNL